MTKLLGAIVSLSVAVMASSSCQSTDNAEASKVNASVVENRIAASCADQSEACEDNGSDMVCTADRYDAVVLTTAELIKGWGSSICAAKNDLRARVCKSGKDIKKVGEVSCAPDPSEGRCAQLANKCDREDKNEVCFATSYDGDKLQPDQIVSGRGGGECEARYQMQINACALNLVPDKLGDVACLEDRTAEKCPVPPGSCGGDYFPFICEGSLSGGILKNKYDARVFAENSCLAETTIKQIACGLNISPDEIKGLRCFADR